MQFFHTITGHGENLSLRIKHDSSHGYLPMTGSLIRCIKRHLHGAACIGLNHDAMMRCMTLSRPSRFQNSAPLIGLTLDHEPGGGGKFSRYPFHALRENYLTALSEAGGLPVCLGYTADAEAMVARLDALVITGGAFDVDPALYDEDPHPLTSPRPARTSAELALLRAALKRDIPILGICGGMQLMAVNAGGTLIQHLPPELEHEQPNPRHEPGHAVSIVPDTRLAEIVGMPTMMVNSSHHQAVRSSGEARISALAPDGVIEAIELDDPKFAIGVQWHPEFTLDPGDRRLYAALVEAAAR